MKFYIKIGVPTWDEARNWGDYHYARAMLKALEKQGHQVFIQILPEWNSDDDADSDVTVHLMGLSHYKPKKGPLNVMWLISHPEKVPEIDFSNYDLLFVASRPLAVELRAKMSIPVFELLQFADTFSMYPQPRDRFRCDLLFVGNSRKVYRRIIKDLMPTPYELKIWGTHWEKYIPAHYIQGNYFPYEKLRQLYSSAAIVLNDHWDEMRQWDFINNRIFDALACRGFVLSDRVNELDRLLPETVETYETPAELHEKIDFFLKNPEVRQIRADAGYQAVRARHGVEIRMQEFMEKMSDVKPQKKSPIFFSWGMLRHLFRKKIKMDDR